MSIFHAFKFGAQLLIGSSSALHAQGKKFCRLGMSPLDDQSHVGCLSEWI
jgi:hypothetical protein